MLVCAKMMLRLNIPVQCMTLSPVVKLQAEIASPEHKEWLAGALFHFGEASTGSVEGDISKLSEAIAE